MYRSRDKATFSAIAIQAQEQRRSHHAYRKNRLPSAATGTQHQDISLWEKPGLVSAAPPVGCGAPTRAPPEAGGPVGCPARTGLDPDGIQLPGFHSPGDGTSAAPCNLPAPGPVLESRAVYVAGACFPSPLEMREGAHNYVQEFCTPGEQGDGAMRLFVVLSFIILLFLGTTPSTP